jgi:hypothetical protein
MISDDTMNAREAIQQGAGWYWWRFRPGWGWRPVEVVKKNQGWQAAGISMDPGSYMDSGEYLYIGQPPEDFDDD